MSALSTATIDARGTAWSADVGGRIVIVPNPRDLPDVLGNINKYKPAYFPGVPAMYVGINNNPDVAEGKYDVKSIRACISGFGSAISLLKRACSRRARGPMGAPVS